MPVTPTASSAQYLLELGGMPCGTLQSVAGGDISAPVIETKVGPNALAQKHLGAPVYEEFVVELGFGLAPDVYEWIAASWSEKLERRDGSVVVTDPSLQAKSEREFTNALITETTIPALDASSKNAALLTVAFAPELIKSGKGSGKVSAPAKGKPFLSSQFRLELDGLDCSEVTKIDAFTVGRTTTLNAVGDLRDYQKEPGALDFPDLFVTIAEAGAQTWNAWFDDFVLAGNNDDSKEKNGAIVFLTTDLKAEVGRISLYNVGICALRHGKLEAGAERVARLTAQLYCERMEFLAGAAKPPAVVPVPVPKPPMRVVR